MSADAFRQAQEAEADGRYLESLALVHRVLAQLPEDPDALNLLGRLCAGGGDLASAIGLQRLALQVAPGHGRAAADLAAALASIPDAAAGEAAFAAACAIEPEIAIHFRIPSSLAPFARLSDVRELLELALRAHPGLAAAHAALGNVAAREGRAAEALLAYRRAAALDPQAAPVLLAVAEIAHVLGDDVAADRYRAAALAQQQLYAEPRTAGDRRARVLVLSAPAPWTANVPLDLIADCTRLILDRLYLAAGAAGIPTLPPYEVAFIAIGESEAAQPAIAAAARFVAAQAKPVMNPPQHLARTARPALAAALRGVGGCTVPAAIRVASGALRALPASARNVEGLAFPLVIRPVDAHGGRGLARLDNAVELAGYVAAGGAARYDLAQFVDYRGPDGWYRKYRVVLVDGLPFPVHLAIGDRWMVHYEASPARETDWMRAEEERFIDDPGAAFGEWASTFPAIARALGLDYVGLDCARLANGNVLVFEADTATWVHAHDAEQAPYRTRAVARIADGLAAAFERRCR